MREVTRQVIYSTHDEYCKENFETSFIRINILTPVTEAGLQGKLSSAENGS